MVILAVGVLLVWVGVLVWRYGTSSGRRFHEQGVTMKAARFPQPASAVRRDGPARLSEVGERTAAGLACPICGGTQWKAHRTLGTKLAFGLASMLGNARRVRCVTCGTDYVRG